MTTMMKVGFASILWLCACDGAVAPVDTAPGPDGKADGPGEATSPTSVGFVSDQGLRFRLTATPVIEQQGAARTERATDIGLEVTVSAGAANGGEAALLHYCRAQGSPWGPPRTAVRPLVCATQGARRLCSAAFDDLEVRRHGTGVADFECRQEVALLAAGQWQVVPGGEAGEEGNHNFPLLLGPGLVLLTEQGHRVSVAYTPRAVPEGSATRTYAEAIHVTVAKRDPWDAMAIVVLDLCRGAGSGTWSLHDSQELELDCGGGADEPCEVELAPIVLSQRGSGVADFECRQELALVVGEVWQDVPGLGGHNFPLLLE